MAKTIIKLSILKFLQDFRIEIDELMKGISEDNPTIIRKTYYRLAIQLNELIDATNEDIKNNRLYTKKISTIKEIIDNIRDIIEEARTDDVTQFPVKLTSEHEFIKSLPRIEREDKVPKVTILEPNYDSIFIEREDIKLKIVILNVKEVEESIKQGRRFNYYLDYTTTPEYEMAHRIKEGSENKNVVTDTINSLDIGVGTYYIWFYTNWIGTEQGTRIHIFPRKYLKHKLILNELSPKAIEERLARPTKQPTEQTQTQPEPEKNILPELLSFTEYYNNMLKEASSFSGTLSENEIVKKREEFIESLKIPNISITPLQFFYMEDYIFVAHESKPDWGLIVPMPLEIYITTEEDGIPRFYNIDNFGERWCFNGISKPCIVKSSDKGKHVTIIKKGEFNKSIGEEGMKKIEGIEEFRKYMEELDAQLGEAPDFPDKEKLE